MIRIRPMPLQTGFFRLVRLRGSIAALTDGTTGKYTPAADIDFPSFHLPPVPPYGTRQPQMKPAPIDLRLRMDLRDVRLYVDVIVDMLLQSLDSGAYSGALGGNYARVLASNPEARRVLTKLLTRAEILRADKSLSAEEIIRMLARETPAAGDVLVKLPATLKDIAVTSKKAAGQSRLLRRERLVREARRLVAAQFPMYGQGARVITKQRGDGSALHVIVPAAEAFGREEPAKDGKRESGTTEQKATEKKREKTPEKPPSPVPPRIEYLRDYRRENERPSMELARRLVDDATLKQLSGEAAASLNRMIEQGKLVPAKALQTEPSRADISDGVMTYAKLYPGGRRESEMQQGASAAKSPGKPVLHELSMRHLKFAQSRESVTAVPSATGRKIADKDTFMRRHAAVMEQIAADRPSMLFAQAPFAAVAAEIEARQTAERQTPPTYAAPDMAKLKNELAKQAGKELDDIIKRKLNVDKLTDKIYRNLENRLRSERIRKGIV